MGNVCSATCVKGLLKNYINREREIDSQSERLLRLVTRMTTVEAQCMSDMPSSHEGTADRLADYVYRKEQLEAEIRADIEKQRGIRELVETIINGFSRPCEKSVIRLHYIDAYDWNDVLDIMYGWKSDYEEKMDSYRRGMFKEHGNALAKIADYLTENPDKLEILK